MLITIKEVERMLETLHIEVKAAIAGLPVEALDWTPAPGMNSLGVLAAHIAGAERYWIGTVAANDPRPRDRDAEFRTRHTTAAELAAALDAALEHSRAALAKLTPLDLEQERVAPRDSRRVTAAWAMLHGLEHTATHLGHMQVLRDLWEQQAGTASRPAG